MAHEMEAGDIEMEAGDIGREQPGYDQEIS